MSYILHLWSPSQEKGNLPKWKWLNLLKLKQIQKSTQPIMVNNHWILSPTVNNKFLRISHHYSRSKRWVWLNRLPHINSLKLFKSIKQFTYRTNLDYQIIPTLQTCIIMHSNSQLTTRRSMGEVLTTLKTNMVLNTYAPISQNSKEYSNAPQTAYKT